ncbi:DUF4192 family protein [Arthrobacter cavernae]|uniref:DUF4192 domain-containing protein n=1 Tax=Arthrobacter cavernae TaxID=2817681 RepID=A0A939KPX8_9MICC|nr:DUF4192 family protein [Arthrobacter cavernae]MBO1269385.1 DUF4192 domain-containing protein [Arthrobacter cavernae]
MTSKERMTISQPEDVLGFIPHVLGYWPADSLVAITMQGNTLGATLRVDLPASGSRSILPLFAARVRDYLAADERADGVLLAVFTDAGWQDGTLLERNMPLLAELQEVLGGGPCVREAWFVGSEYWRSAYCTDAECCPAPGRPVEQIRDSRLNAEMVYRGSNVAAPLFTGMPRGADPRSRGALDSEERHLLQMLRRWRSRRSLDAVLELWCRVLDGPGAPLTPELLGFLRASLRVPAWRDAVAVMAAAGTAAARGGAEAFGYFTATDDEPPLDIPDLAGAGEAAGSETAGPETAGAETAGATDEDAGPLSYGDVLLGLRPDIPDWPRMERLETVLFGLRDAGGGEALAAILTLQGWIHWCKGSGSFAHGHFVRADAEQPGYRLAELLGEVVRRGTICGWARRREAAWRKFGGTAA